MLFIREWCSQLHIVWRASWAASALTSCREAFASKWYYCIIVFHWKCSVCVCVCVCVSLCVMYSLRHHENVRKAHSWLKHVRLKRLTGIGHLLFCCHLLPVMSNVDDHALHHILFRGNHLDGIKPLFCAHSISLKKEMFILTATMWWTLCSTLFPAVGGRLCKPVRQTINPNQGLLFLMSSQRPGGKHCQDKKMGCCLSAPEK